MSVKVEEKKSEDKAEDSTEKNETDSSKEDIIDESMLEEAREQGENQILENLKKRLTSGDSTTQIFRDFYPDDLIVYDQGAFQFIPKNYDLQMHEFDTELFSTAEDGRLNYDDDSYELLHGIDVSKYQGKIDWTKLKEQGIDYAILRVGIRGYSEGSIKDDDTFVTNIEGAIENDIQVGVYFFTQAINNEESLEEAEYVLEKIKDYKLDYPVYIDVEHVASSSCRTKDLNKHERTALIKTFLNRIKEEGYEAGIYGNTKSFLLMMDLEELEEYPKWLASYSLPLYYPYDFEILQYSESGKLTGIKEKVDLNLQLRKKEQATMVE